MSMSFSASVQSISRGMAAVTVNRCERLYMADGYDQLTRDSKEEEENSKDMHDRNVKFASTGDCVSNCSHWPTARHSHVKEEENVKPVDE